MTIIFKYCAYATIGFSNRYTGKFIIDGDTYIESDKGVHMTVNLPEKWVTVGRQLTERK